MKKGVNKEFYKRIFSAEKREFRSNPVPLNQEIPKRHPWLRRHAPTHRSTFCDDNPSNNPETTTKHPTPLCSHFHNPDDISSQTGKSKPEKKIYGLKHFFYKSPAPRKTKIKHPPFSPVF